MLGGGQKCSVNVGIFLEQRLLTKEARSGSSSQSQSRLSWPPSPAGSSSEGSGCWLSSQERTGLTACPAVCGRCPLVLVDRSLKSCGYLSLGSEVPHLHPHSDVPFKSLVANGPAQCGGWRVSPGAGSWVLPSQVPSLIFIPGGRGCASPCKPGREIDTSFAWLK